VDVRQFNQAISRSKSFIIEKEDATLEKGDSYELTITSDDLRNAEAAFFNLNVDPSSLTLKDVSFSESASATVIQNEESESHIGLSIYSNSSDYKVVLTFEAKDAVRISEAIRLHEKISSKVISSSYEESEVDLAFSQGSRFAHLTITPNPINREATIIYTTDISESVDIEIFTVDGKLIHAEKLDAQKGTNTLRINRSQLQSESAVIYISATSSTSRIIQKAAMVH